MAPQNALDALAPWLRRRVAALRAMTVRRTFPVSVEVVHGVDVGTGVAPGQRVAAAEVGTATAGWTCDEPLDRGLRVDLLYRLMAGAAGDVVVVVVRPGHHETRTESDRAWAGAAFEAAGIYGHGLVGVVMVSRWGWLDLLTGAHRSWKRLRIRRS